jgi:hypothetical protein
MLPWHTANPRRPKSLASIAYLPSAFPRPRLSPPWGVWVGGLKQLHEKPHVAPPFCRKGKCGVGRLAEDGPRLSRFGCRAVIKFRLCRRGPGMEVKLCGTQAAGGFSLRWWGGGQGTFSPPSARHVRGKRKFRAVQIFPTAPRCRKRRPPAGWWRLRAESPALAAVEPRPTPPVFSSSGSRVIRKEDLHMGRSWQGYDGEPLGALHPS